MSPADLWKPTNPDFIQDPYRAYKQIGKLSKVFKAKTGDFVIMGYQDCKYILQDPSFETGLRLKWIEKMAKESALRNQPLEHVKQAVSGMLVQINPPAQQKIKADFAKAWPSIEEIKTISQEVIIKALEELPHEFNAIDLLCRKIPVQIISRLLRLNEQETQDHAVDGINLVQILSPYLTYRDIQSIDKSTTRLQTFLRGQILSDTYVPTKLTERIIASYPEEEMINLLLFFFTAGYETTSSLLTLCLFHLIKNKNHKLNIEKYGPQPFIDEILRRHSPVQITGRTNTKSIELHGQSIPKDSALTLCIGAANVDSDQFESAEEFKWNRAKREHLSFGYGMHFCLGNQLAEIEAEILIEQVLPILDKFEITANPVLRNMLTLKSYQSFDLRYK